MKENESILNKETAIGLLQCQYYEGVFKHAGQYFIILIQGEYRDQINHS